MRNAKKIGRQVLACFLSACMTVGTFTGYGMIQSKNNVSAAASGFTSNDFLKCDGTSIRNNYGKGNNIYLRGTNAGGWLVQEGWMCSSNIRDQKTLMANLESRFGTSTMYELLDLYEANYWTEADFDNCKNMGMSVIRLPFTYMNLYKYDSSKKDWVLRTDAFKRLDWFVEQCSQRGIYVILDLHGAFGSQNGQDHSGEVIDSVSNVTFFSNDTYKNKTLELWRTVAAHYAGNPAVAAYDTLNEPGEKAGSTNSKHWAFYDQMYKAIRAVDPDHIVIMESCWGTGNLPNPNNYGWKNVMYEYHHYTWDHISNLSGQKSACDNLINSVNNANYGVPTFIGEFTCFGLEDAWTYVMNRFNNAGWHYTSWSYKTNNSGSWGIYNEKTTAKINPTSDSLATIKANWGAGSIGTGAQSSSGMVYKTIKAAMPGTVVLANKALTDADYFTIKAGINSKYVTADNYGQSSLVANRNSGGGWEQFRVIYNSDGTISFQSRANNKYLCAVFDHTDKENPVIARSNAIGAWEKFYLEKQNDGTYALRTYVNNYYVQTDIGDATAGILHACGTSVGTWEKFTFEAVSNASALPGTNTQPETTTVAPTTTVQPTTPATKTVNCPGTFVVNEYSAKSSEIIFGTDNGTLYAGNLINGSYLEYKVNVKEAGKYTLGLNLATTSSGRTLTISVDGAQAATMSPGVAGSWFTFGTYTAVVSFATAGTHTLRISTNGSCNIATPTLTAYEEEVSVPIPSTGGKYGNNFKAVAYYPNWYGDITSSMQWDKLTHVNYSFALPNASGTLDSIAGSASVIRSLVTAAHNNNVKVLLAVGGWSYSDGTLCQYTFESATNTDAKCQSLANSILSAVDQYGFDGVDIDWEYPTSGSATQYTKFMTYLRNGLTQRGMLLTAAVAATSGTYQTDSVLSMVDWINVMAYDGNSGSGHSPYSLLTDSFKYWNTTRKVPASKVVLGVPFYERPNWASYASIVSADSANAYKDSAVINGTTVYYNGLTTMASKATFAAQNAGGIMIWEISQDSKNATYSLLNAIYKAATDVVGTGGKATVTELPGTVSVKSYGGKSSTITFGTSASTEYAGNLTNGSYLDYYVKVPAKGEYTITLKLAAGDAQYNAKNMLVKLNDNTVSTLPITASSSWTTFIDHTATINFAAKGTYKLSLVSEGGACNVADFAITKKTETATTVAPTTKAPETTTQASSTQNPIEVFGLVVNAAGNNTITVVWGQNQDQIASGQKYNIYVNGVKKLSSVACGAYTIESISAGSATVKVTAVLGSKETAGTTATVNVSGQAVAMTQSMTKVPETTAVPITKAPETTKAPVATNASAYDTWNANAIYVGGDKVTYKGIDYKAKWWTQGDNPETQGQWGPWEKIE